MQLRFLLPALLALLSGCGAPDPLAGLPCGMLMLAEMPVTMAAGVPLVPVTIAGQRVTMILDTGAQKTLLTQSAVNRLHLRSDAHTVTVIRGVGGASRNFPAILTGLNVGGQPLADQPALALPFDLPVIGGVTVDGLLGADVLGRFEMDLDLPHRRVGLYGGRLCPGEEIPLPGPLVEMAAPGINRNRLVVQAALDGEAVTALLDTGAAATIVMTPAMLRTGTDPAALQSDPIVSLSGVGPSKVAAKLHQFTTLSLAGETLIWPRLRVTEPLADDAWWLFLEPDDDDMVIGMDYLAQRHLWFAYPRSKVFLQRRR
jgi:predicted aspartyl protease